jgi:hypothetical protein|tara:strand:- start:74 stop:364 length:291 start_codon:yes stop_codon:yes gene_type:complete
MSNKIDVWLIIKSILKKHNPVTGIAFIATRAYGHGFRQVASLLKGSSAELEDKLNKIEKEINQEVKRQGGDPEMVSNVYNVHNVMDFIEDEDESEN